MIQMVEIETHIKIVKGKTVLVPSLELLKSYLPAASKSVDTTALRKAMTTDHATALVCPVTMRKHLKELGLVILPNLER